MQSKSVLKRVLKTKISKTPQHKSLIDILKMQRKMYEADWQVNKQFDKQFV